MNRDRGTAVTRAQVLIVLAMLVSACVPVVSLPPTATPTPVPTPILPTPVPTPAVSEAPSPSPADAGTRLVIRLSSCSHTCGPEPGTSIYADGRVIWADQFLRPLEGRLTPAALQRVRDELAETGILEESGGYPAQLRPGAEPVPRGLTLHRFERDLDGGRVVVTSGDTGDFVDEPDLWIIPSEMVVLTDLAQRLRDPLAWLRPAAFLEPASPYAAERYIVVIDLFPDAGADGLDVDVDEVAWPIGAPIESVGVPFDPIEEGLESRCLIIDRSVAEDLAAAEARSGAGARDLSQWGSSLEYGWARAAGAVAVTTIPLLPHETGTCAEILVPEAPPPVTE